MDRQVQFSLWQLFGQLTLTASLAGAIRLIWVYGFGPSDVLHCLVALPAMCAVPILVGAVVGGFHGSFGRGALWGAGVLGAVILLILLFGPGPQ